MATSYIIFRKYLSNVSTSGVDCNMSSGVLSASIMSWILLQFPTNWMLRLLRMVFLHLRNYLQNMTQ